MLNKTPVARPGSSRASARPSSRGGPGSGRAVIHRERRRRAVSLAPVETESYSTSWSHLPPFPRPPSKPIHLWSPSGLKPCVPACCISVARSQGVPPLSWTVPLSSAPFRGQSDRSLHRAPVNGSARQLTPVQLPVETASLYLRGGKGCRRDLQCERRAGIRASSPRPSPRRRASLLAAIQRTCCPCTSAR